MNPGFALNLKQLKTKYYTTMKGKSFSNLPVTVIRRAPGLLTVIICLLSCKSAEHSNADIELAMRHYDHLIMKLDADSISMLYTPDGNLGDIAIGRDSIKRFLSSFKNVKVLSQSSTSDSIHIFQDTAIQKGRYMQTDLIDGKDTVNVKGEYVTQWQWIKNKGWHIKHMTTKPVK